VAVVLAQNRLRRLEPRVQVLTGADKVPIGMPFERNLSASRIDREPGQVRIVRGLANGAYGLRPGELVARPLTGTDHPA